MNAAVRRLRHDLRKLSAARREHKQDKKALHKDLKALKQDRRQLDRHRDAFESGKKALTGDRKALQGLRETAEAKLSALRARQAEVQAQFEATVDPVTGQGDPAIEAKLEEVSQRLTDVEGRFDSRIAGRKAEVEKGQRVVQRHRQEIQGERKEIKQDRREIKQDRKELGRDRERIAHWRKEGREELRPAVFHMGLKATNRARKALGLKPVDHVIRPTDLSTVKGCARFILQSKNVSFWSGLSTGSDRKNLERLAQTGKAFVPATGQWITPKLSMMKALAEMAKRGPIQINALTGGIHSTNSNHYRGTAVDLQVGVGSTSQIVSIANRHGGFRNHERTHIHLDF